MTRQSTPHYDRINFYTGLTVVDELNTQFLNVDSALKRVQKTWGPGVLRAPAVTAESPPSANITIGAGAVVCNDGNAVTWSSNTTINTSIATAGSLQGNTAVTTTGNIRWVIIGVRSKIELDEAVINRLGDTEYKNHRSGYEFLVYGSAEQVSGTNWRGSTIVSNLVQTMRNNDFAEPLAIVELAYGSMIAQTNKVWRLQTPVWEAGSPREESHFSRVASAYIMPRPVVQTSTATIAATPNIQVGLPGSLTIPGGESLLIGYKDPKDGGAIRIVQVTLPAATINLPLANTVYVVRMNLDEDGVPTIYYGTGDYPLDPPYPQDGKGTQDGTQQGFTATLVDTPLAIVTTQNNGQIPLVEKVKCSAAFSLDARVTSVESRVTTVENTTTSLTARTTALETFRNLILYGHVVTRCVDCSSNSVLTIKPLGIVSATVSSAIKSLAHLTSTTINPSTGGLSTSTHYHVYAKINGSSLEFSKSTDAPDDGYMYKSGNTDYLWVSTFWVDSAGNIVPYTQTDRDFTFTVFSDDSLGGAAAGVGTQLHPVNGIYSHGTTVTGTFTQSPVPSNARVSRMRVIFEVLNTGSYSSWGTGSLALGSGMAQGQFNLTTHNGTGFYYNRQDTVVEFAGSGAADPANYTLDGGAAGGTVYSGFRCAWAHSFRL